MPELPEVQTVVNQLSKKIIGKVVDELRIVCASCVCNPQGFDLRALGKVLSVDREGKFIIIYLDSGVKAVIHLRMTGKIVWEEGNNALKTKGLRAEFKFSGGGKILFYSVRGFARLDLWSACDKVSGLENLGLDPFDKKLDKNLLAEMLKGRKVAIKSFLMDQRHICGIGNIYACEILYRVGVHPQSKAGCLSLDKIEEILQITRQVLSKAIECCGTTVNDYRNIDDKTGQFQNFLQVYQKNCCPKGHRLQKVTVGGRGTYFCPECQKLEQSDLVEQTIF